YKTPEVPVTPTPEDPIEKEVEGDKEKVIGQEYNYNVKVHVPEDVSELKSLTVTDKLDSRLDFVEATVKEDEDLTPTEKDRLVTLTLDEKALEKHAGKTLTLEITTKINETAKIGEDIPNTADLVFEHEDGTKEEYKTPEVPVTPTPEDPIEKEVEGDKEKVIGQEYNYNVKVHVPEDVSELKSITVTDKLDSRLDFVDAAVKEDKELTPTEKDRLVTLTLDENILEKHAGKTLTLEITAKINETAEVGEDIPNTADLVFEHEDGTKEEYKTPEVPVTPTPEDPIEKEVEGDKEKVIGQEYNYNVKVHVPEDVSELKSLTVTDKLDSRLDFVEATVKEDEDLTPTEKDRLVTLTLDEKALEKHAGKTLTLEITTKINVLPACFSNAFS